MIIRPRQQILDIWRAVARTTADQGQWSWDSAEEPNSVNAAEKLLCLMYPAYELDGFRFDAPDETAADVLEALHPLGDRVGIPKRMTDILAEYLATYTDAAGAPRFSAGGYLRPGAGGGGEPPTAAQADLDIVTSMSMSLTLTLSSLGFLRSFGREVHRPQLKAKLASVEAALSRRLTAAMVGLIRSFTVRSFPQDSPEGRVLLDNIGRSYTLDWSAADELLRLLRPVRSSLLESAPFASDWPDLDNDDMFFECGWTWSVRENAPEVPVTDDIGAQPEGTAAPEPDLYFTVVALDGLMDIFSERTLMLGLLNREQQQLAQTLRLQAEITHRYWSTLARFGESRWQLERLPWQTVDGRASDYHSLLVMSVIVQDLQRRQAGDDDLARTVDALELLAARAKLCQRSGPSGPTADPRAGTLDIDLKGSEKLGPPLVWRLSDFTAILLKRAVQFAGLAREIDSRDRLMRLAEAAMEHVWESRLRTGAAAGLWHEPQCGRPPNIDETRGPSWYFTERVVESLVAAAAMLRNAPLRNARMAEIARGMLVEAEHLIGQELLNVSTGAATSLHASLQRMQSSLHRAREIVRERPGSAYAIVAETLRELDELDAARQSTALGA